MKKFFAALLAISITVALAGCGNKPADEQLIDDITEEISAVTETAETVSETETAVSADIEAEDTTLKKPSKQQKQLQKKRPIPKNAEKPFLRTLNHFLANGMP